MSADELPLPNPRHSLFAVWHWPRWVWFVIVPVILLAYPLSIGPATYLFAKGYLGENSGHALNQFYDPLHSICARNETSDAALSYYIQWWAHLAGG